MPVILSKQENVLTANISGEIDHHNAKKLRESIDKQTEDEMPKKLVLNFKDVTFMDSSGIGLVLGRCKLMQEIGGVVEVVNISSHTKKVMKLAGLDKLAVIGKE